MRTYNNYKFPFLHRFLHWSIAITILFILLTVFLRLEWMSKENVGEIIFKDLQQKNITISQAEAQSIAKDIRKPMFNWHIYLGYVLIGLYIIRVLYLFIKGIKFHSPLSGNSTFKQKFQAVIYILFYIILGITLLSGFLIVNGPKDYKGFLEEIHAPALYFMLGFTILHFIGIFIGEKTTEKGVVSAMISGEKE